VKLVTAERLRRIRRVGRMVLAAAGLQGFARRHLGGLRGRMKAREQELEAQAREDSSLDPLIQDLRGVAAGVPSYGAPGRSAPRVLLFTGRGMWTRDTPLVDGLLFHALSQRGAICSAVLCGAALPACEVENVTVDSAEELLSRGQPKICASCVGSGSRIYEALGVPFRTMSGALRAADYRRAKEVVANIPYEEYFEHREDGVAVGAHARASVMRYLLSGRLSDTPIDRAVAERFMVSALVVMESARRLIGEFEPDVVVANHGIYNQAGVFADVAASFGARTVAWCRAYRKNTVIFSQGKSYHYEMIDEPISEWEHRKLTTDESDRLDEYLASRNRGSMDWLTYHPHPIEDRDVLIQTLGLDPERPTVGLFTNVNWDGQIAYPQNAFRDQLSWVIQTIEHFRIRPDLQLVIRVHPAETKAVNISQQRMADEIRAAFPALPRNVYIIPPESDLSSYTLADLIDAGIVFATKLGLEMAVRGVPVVVAGDAWVRGKGLTYDASSPEEYAHILQRIERLPRMSPRLVERARLYAHHFFFRRLIPFPVDIGTNPREDSVTLDLETIDELLPGRNPAIDVICSGILNGTPFVFDEGLAGTPYPLSWMTSS
jgi:capsular polysaccharide biosynthesis protein